MITKSLKINRTFIFLIVVFLVLQIIFFNIDSNSGEQLVKISTNLEEIRNENNRISQKIASISSIANIALKASELGFQENKNTRSLTAPLPIAYKESLSL